jgi:trehalose synthase
VDGAAMTSMLTERVRTPRSAREARALEAVRKRMDDGLADRTVWCTSGLRAGRIGATTLHDGLRRTGAEAGRLEPPGDEPLRRLCERLDALLRGRTAAEPAPEDGDVYAGGVERGEDMLGDTVAPGDVVVLHDPLTTVLGQAARERGAHVLWRLPAVSGRRGVVVAGVWSFMCRYTAAPDAYVAASSGPGVHRIVAIVPSRGLVAAKEVDPAQHDLGWSSMLADVVQADRDETVGGIFHARPTVAVR